MEVTNTYVTIKAQIDGAPQESDFELKTESFSLLVKPESKDVIIKNLYVSIDPYDINRMKTVNVLKETSENTLQISPGEVIDAYGLGRVISSGNPQFEKGDYVVGFLSWAEYSISKGFILRKLDPAGMPLSYHVGLLGGSDAFSKVVVMVDLWLEYLVTGIF
ncbi:NADP(+)-dependent 2-alkenal reductase-like protein [Tanacetum coccineum]